MIGMLFETDVAFGVFLVCAALTMSFSSLLHSEQASAQAYAEAANGGSAELASEMLIHSFGIRGDAATLAAAAESLPFLNTSMRIGPARYGGYPPPFRSVHCVRRLLWISGSPSVIEVSAW